jgi:metallo-beta-lactamase family protein
MAGAGVDAHSPVSLAFLGAASTVTGSCFLVTTEKGRLLVDCGLFQGTKTVRELNYKDFPFEPGAIDALLLTHAHIDHSGLVPKLVRKGFKGPIIATEPTADLLAFMLPDSGYIQESEVDRLNRRNRQRGRPPVEPIYTRRDAEAALEQIRTCAYDEWLEPMPGTRARFWNAGHILGSASIELEIHQPGGRPLRLLFSGDIGPDEKAFHDVPEGPADLDYLVVEATYGDRDRAEVTLDQRRARLGEEVRAALAAGGNLLIPAFAVERTQELLETLARLIRDGVIPEVPVFIDSPLAINITRTFAKHHGDLVDIEGGANLFEAPWMRFTESVDESKAINQVKGGAIIMAASGMCDAGRIRHHLKQNLWRRDATVLFVGYQAPGSLGQIIQSGAARVRIHGEEVAVNARIRTIESFSAHADQGELVAWVQARLPVRNRIFLSHGEPRAMQALRAKLAEVGLDPAHIVAPALDDRFDLEVDAAPVRHAQPRRLSEAAAAAPSDWHNAYARLLLDMGEKLKALDDDKARGDLLAALRRTLDG